jgi:lipopolysaccharide export system protein LptA
MSQVRKRANRTQSEGLAAALYAGSRLERTAITLGTGIALFLMFFVYRTALSGLRPPPARSPRVARPTGSETTDHFTTEDLGGRKAQQYLPDTWVPKASHCVKSEDGHTFCFFQEWTRESAHIVKFTPFAMISHRKGDKPGDPPYTVMSDKAYITFKDEFGPAGKNPGPVVRAGLEGTVEIGGPNNLKIRGRNFFFEREAMRIYSDSLVVIEADKHRAIAKGIQLELIAAEKTRSDDSLSIAGVSSVKLLQNVEMTLISGADARGGGLPGLAKPTDKGPQIVRTHCDGSFVFYVEAKTATFERNVRIRRETTPGKYDALFSDEDIKIEFESKKPGDAKNPGGATMPAGKSAEPKPGATAVATTGTAPAAGSGTPADRSPGGLDPNLTFKTVHATGKTVALTSDANGLKSEMREFHYDQNAREAKLAWIPRDTDRERTVRDKTGLVRKIPPPNCVYVSQHGNTLHAQKIQLNHDPQGEVTHVLCLGQGDMQHVDEKTGQVDLAADWHKEMRKYPDPTSSSFDLIHLEEALIEQPKDGAGIAANYIRLWVTRQNRQGLAARANQPPAAPQASGPHLDHMLAWQKVAMVSPQIECDTDHLEIWFENGPGTQRRTPAAAPRQRANLVPTSDYVVRGPAAGVVSTAPPRSGPGSHPNAAATSQPTKTGVTGLLATPGASTDPYNLTAGWVRVLVLEGPEGQQPQVADVIAKGKVHLTQAHGEAAEPLVVEGNELQVQNRGETDQEMIVLGQPAHVRDRGAHIEGGRVRFNRARNTADVDGPGRLQLPVQQAGAGGDAVPPNNDDPAKPLDVMWQQKMHFDGKTAHFYVNVHTSMTDAQSQSQVRCLNMDVTLTKPFSFSQQQPQQQQQLEADRPAVDTVFCQGDVEFESQSTQGDHLSEVRRGQFMDLLFHKLTGKSTANGPGVLQVWRRSENGQSGIAQFTNVHSNAPPKARKSTEWSFQQVKFSGRMDGDFSDLMTSRSRPKSESLVRPASGTSSVLATNGAWTTTFRESVEVLYGPVDQQLELVSRDELSEESGCLLCEFLQVMQHPQSPTEAQHIEMVAKGNAQIEGKTFRGESDTITYDGSKTLYVLVGDKAGPARLWRQTKIGAAPGTNSANRIYFNPITHMVKEDGTQNFDMQQ